MDGNRNIEREPSGSARRFEISWRWYRSHPLFCFAALSACSLLLLYRSILRAPFVYDDQDQIQTNPALLSWHSFVTNYVEAAHPFSGTFRGSGGGASYRPLFWLSLAVDRHVYGLNVTGYHLTNLLLHWANGLFAFALLRRCGASGMLAALTALIWLSLPINSEAVAWISGRAYCLLAFFVFLSLLFAQWYLRKGAYMPLLFYCIAFIGALLSHEAGILVLPFVLLLAHLRASKDTYSARRLYIAGSAFTLIYLLVRAGSLGSSLNPKSWALWPAGMVIAKYLSWMVLPIHMSIERSTEIPPDSLSAANAGAWCVVF